jgi:hypothetical protein
MQTFLPHRDFHTAAECLDNRRLSNQLNECKEIARTILGETTGWASHPAAGMWRDYLPALIEYGCACYDEWQRRLEDGERGGKMDHKSGEWLRTHLAEGGDVVLPPWLTDEVASAYRALLLSKSEHYTMFGWAEDPCSDSKSIFEMILSLGDS